MTSIIIALGAFFTTYGAYIAIRILTGIGLGIISYAAVGLAVESLFNAAKGHYNNIPTFALQLLGLAGAGDSLGLITGAITFRLTFVFMNRIGVLPK